MIDGQTVNSHDAAQVQGRRLRARAATPRLPPADLAFLWRNTIRYTSALVVAAFPLLFLYDEAADLGFSPVLPGLVLLIVLMVVLPPMLVELRVRRLKNVDVDRARILRSVQTSWACLGVAIVWLLFWFAWGV